MTVENVKMLNCEEKSKMKYQVVVDGEVVKEYEHKLQALAWCYNNGHVVSGKGMKWIVGAEIKEINDSSSPSHEE